MAICLILRIALLGLLAIPATVLAGQQGTANLPMDRPAAVQRAIHLSHAEPSQVLHLAVSMPFADEDGMQRFVDSVSDPKSPNYRHFLSPEQVGQQFGLPIGQVQKVVRFLKSQGMSVTLVGKNRLSILADATVTQAERAFKTSIEQYASTDPADSEDPYRFSFTNTPSVPAELSNLVSDVAGMEDFTRPQKRYLTPSQAQTLYGAAAIYSGGSHGQGRTVGISSWDGFRLSNASSFISYYSLPIPSGGVLSNVKVQAIDGGSGAGKQNVEGDMDIQCTLAIAPLANVIVYDGYGGDVINVLTKEVNDNTADIITESYGWGLQSSTATSAHTLHLSMSAQGITYLAASGDTGTTLSYPYPDCEPEVLIVGGTSTSTDSSGNRTSEVTWPGGGGGWATSVTNTFNVKPAYQSGIGPSGVNYRLVPDIAANADPNTGYTLYLTAGSYPGFTIPTSGVYRGFAGTSAASPTMAASLALAEEQIIAQGGLAANSAGKQRFGRINDLLYSYSGNSSVFFDVTSGTNGNLPNGAVSTAGPGWDTATGWGAPNFQGLVNKVVGLSVSSLTLSATTIVGGGSITGTVKTSAAAPAGGQVVSLSSSSTSATVPASVTIAAGSTSATFSISTAAVNASTTVTITATSGVTKATASATITPAVLSAISLSSSSVVGGVTNPTVTVTLNGPAGSSGTVVTLASSATAAAKFSATSVTIGAGKTTAATTVTSFAVNTTTSVTLTATSGVAKTASLSVTGPTVASFTLSTTSMTGNGTTAVTGTVTLTGPAGPSGVTITLKSSNITAVPLPASVTIAAGSKTGTFTFKPAAVKTSTSVTLTATLGTASSTSSFTDV